MGFIDLMDGLGFCFFAFSTKPPRKLRLLVDIFADVDILLPYLTNQLSFFLRVQKVESNELMMCSIVVVACKEGDQYLFSALLPHHGKI